MMTNKIASESIESLLLTPKENKLVVQTLGKGKKSLATGVAQLYLALPSDRTQWTKIGTGVVCLVKDKQEKSFFIRMLDIKEKCVVWEQELYKQFKYRAVSKHFQTFFADDCRAGINFSSTEEAALYRAAIMERVNVFKKKREEARQRKMAAYQQQQKMNYQMSQLAMQNPYFRMPFVPQNLDNRTKNLLFMQMRAPNVAASQRAQLQAMFNSMPPETRQAFLMSLSGGPSMMAQASSPGMWPGQNQSCSSLPSSPSQAPTMPPLPPPDQPQTFTKTTHSVSPDVPPEPPGESGPPVPGPPPPPPPPTCAPPPPVLGGFSSKTKSSVQPSSSDNRNGLLQSIQAGTKLRKVDETTSRRKIPKVESGMRGALARALDNRAKVLGDEDSDEDEEEWDDDDDDDWSD